MHIPDGFLSPQTYLPALAVAIPAWSWALKGLRERLTEASVPRLALTTALAYALGLLMLPLPGGTSAHFLGIGLLALLFGVRLAFLAYSGVLLLQALLFGAGGWTSLPVNALVIGLGGAAAAVGVRRSLAPWPSLSVFVAVWTSVVVPAIVLALLLGLQPWVAHRPDGTPLFFPFGFAITLPALLLPHAFLGLLEAAITLLVWRFANDRAWRR